MLNDVVAGGHQQRRRRMLRKRGIYTASSVGSITHCCSSLFFVPHRFFLMHLSSSTSFKPSTCPTHPRLYISISIASHHAPGILSLRRRGSRRWASAPCRGHWQQRQLNRPVQRGGAPGAEGSSLPIKDIDISILQLRLAAW